MRGRGLAEGISRDRKWSRRLVTIGCTEDDSKASLDPIC